jgi:pimeloyl-ACP methyl ester carboxylesterase
MHDANSHLRIDQARHLTIHGSNQNEDGSYSWKFDNYTHIMSPFDMTQEQTRELWARIDAPLLLVSGKESWHGQGKGEDPVEYFQNARHEMIEKAGHWVHHDQLDQFLALTRAFFAE